MITHTTPDRHGYSIRFSPYNANQMLLATSQLYGLAGGGSLFMFERDPLEEKSLHEMCRLEWTDGLFDVAWSPNAENVAATASGDGSVQIWRGLDTETVSKNETPKEPALRLQEHKNEVYSVCWGEKWNYHTLLSASWDKTIKLWDTNRKQSLATFEGHSDLVYCARFSPLIANVFASVGTDGYLNLWHCFDFSGKPMMSVQNAHEGEVLCCDWSQYDRNTLFTGGSDGSVRAWDLRNMSHHVFELYSGEFAVRRVACSPDAPTVLATANYDFNTRIWDYEQSFDPIEIREVHTESVCGLDWNANRSFELADCGWDAVVNLYTPQCLLSTLEEE